MKNIERFPLFTVILLSYNSRKFIHDSLWSICKQTYPNIELLIADDGSKDFDREFIRSFLEANCGSNFVRTQIIHHDQNIGTVKNINIALQISQGQYIKLLAADDGLFDKDVLTNASREFIKQSCDILLCHVQKCDKELEIIAQDDLSKSSLRKLQLANDKLFAQLCRKNRIMAGSVFMSRSLFDSLGLFDERYRLLEDWPMWLKAAREGSKFGKGNFIAVKYRTNQGVSSGYNPVYIADKRQCFLLEIKPYKRQIGMWHYLLSAATIILTNSKTLRSILK